MFMQLCSMPEKEGHVENSQIQSLLEPGAYLEPASDVRLIQTHISWIFLAGKYAYKVKKPVNFGFLDFSTLDRRKFYCDEEVRLNRRLCPDIYLDVIPVRETPGGASFHGNGRIIDYAVKMLRLPEDRMADRLLARGELTAEDLKRIAAIVADFHHRAARCDGTESHGSLEAVRRNWEENFGQIEDFAGTTLSLQDLRIVRNWVEQFMTANAGLFRSRVEGGFIRECDGDLHLENICLTDRICIFDCIEFNTRFRCIDTAADIAFLLMDLEFYGRRDLAALFLNEYLAESDDIGALLLLNFYRIHRAFIRGKVESFRLKDPGIPEKEKLEARDKARRYFRLARGYVIREGLEPILLVICGLTGSGKSTIAETVGAELGLTVLSSDRLRKELAGVPLYERHTGDYGEGIYSPAHGEATYAELFARADRLLDSGEGVIIDATCMRRKDRESLLEIAERHGAPLYLVLVETPEPVVRERLEERARNGKSISDGRWEVYLRQRDEFEPLLPSESRLLAVDGSAPLHDSVDAIFDAMGLLPAPTGAG
jgi:aminoglycoside phosphotransferase family enzyme/predicted kinase